MILISGTPTEEIGAAPEYVETAHEHWRKQRAAGTGTRLASTMIQTAQRSRLLDRTLLHYSPRPYLKVNPLIPFPLGAMPCTKCSAAAPAIVLVRSKRRR